MWAAWENGINQARNEGFVKGRIEGRVEGIEKGRVEGKVDLAVRFAQKYNISVEEAMETAGVSKHEWDMYAPKQ